MIIKGTDVLLYVDDVAIAHSTSCDLNITTNMIDITSKDSAGWEEILADVKAWSISSSALVDYSAAAGIDDILDAQLAGSTIAMKMSTEVVGHIVLTGNVLVDNNSITNPNQDKSTFDFSARGNGALAKALVV